jgi:hypothetical protein
MRGSAAFRIFRTFHFLVVPVLSPFPNSGLSKAKTPTLRFAKDNHGFPVEKTAFRKRRTFRFLAANLPRFSFAGRCSF